MSAWIRSTRCEAGTCVEARRVGDVVEVRDSKDPYRHTLRFTRAEWDAFLGGVAAGEFAFFEDVPLMS